MDSTTKTQRFLEGAARRLVLSAVCLAPWLYGAAEPWAALLVSGLALLGVWFWFLSATCSRRLVLHARVVCLPLLALTALAVLQLLPLPLPLARLLSPRAAAVAEQSALVFAQLPPFAAPRPGGLTATLSVAARASARSLLLFSAALGVYLVMANTIRRWDQLRRAAGLIAGLTALLAIVAIVHKSSGSHAIFWLHAPRYGGPVFGPFANPHHFGAYLNMAIGAALGGLIASRGFHQLVAWPDWSDRRAVLSSRAGAAAAWRAAALVLLAGAVAVSASRGALFSLVGAFTLVGAWSLHARHAAPRAFWGFCLPMALLLLLILGLGRGHALTPTGSAAEAIQSPFIDLRLLLLGDGLDIIAAFPLFGAGFGTFRHIFGAFQTPPMQFRWLHAHGDWLQLAIEGGLVGAGLFVAAVALWLRFILRRLRTASDQPRFLVVGLLFGLATIAIHSLFDYSLRKPANAMLLAALAGMAVAGVHLRASQAARTAPDGDEIAMPRLAGWSAALVALALATGLLWVVQGQLRGELAIERFRYATHHALRASQPADRRNAAAAGLHEARLATRWARYNPDALTDVGASLLKLAPSADFDDALQDELIEQANLAALEACAGAPADYLGWLWLARAQMAFGAWDGANAALERARALASRPGELRMFAAPERPVSERQIP